METFIVALKSREIKLPKFLLWKIAHHACLELDYSRELAEYFHGSNTFKAALHRGKKLAERMAESMGNEELYCYRKNILIHCSEYLVLRVSDYLVHRCKWYIFERVALSGNVSLLYTLLQRAQYMSVYFNDITVKGILASCHLNMIEYLLEHGLIYTLRLEHKTSEGILGHIVAKLPKETTANYFVRANDCYPHTASVLRKYL